MNENTDDLVRFLQAQEAEHIRDWIVVAPPERPTIHHTELPEDRSNGPISHEWNFYRQQVGRLLAEGHEGKWVLIKGEEIIGIYATQEEADKVRLQRYLLQPVLLKQIHTREPVLRGGGYDRQWPS